MTKVLKWVAFTLLFIPSLLCALAATALCVLLCLTLIGIPVAAIIFPFAWMLPMGVIGMFNMKHIAETKAKLEA